MRALKCEVCEDAPAAAKVTLDARALYLCASCTRAVQAHYPTAARCERCKSSPSAHSVTESVDSATAEGVCDTCITDAERSALSQLADAKKDKPKKKAASDGGVSFGVCAEQGRRPTMEDADVAFTDLAAECEGAPAGSSFYAVYDGHGGKRAAEFVAKTLHHKIIATDAFKAGEIEKAIEDGYAATDDELLRLCDAEDWQDGATAVCALILDNTLWTSCVGDSELVVCVNGEAQCRSFKHKPTVPSERARIQAANGVVLFDRLGASMAVSRSFGDKIHKHPFNGAPDDHMSSRPHIDSMPMKDIEFMIVACDGLWDKFEYDDCVSFVKKMKKKSKSANQVAKALVEEALARGSTDNVSVIVVYF